jgi:hypothetical protein
VGGRRLGRRGVATARATRGARRRDVDGGAVQGEGSTAREPADRGRPQRAGPARPWRRLVRDADVAPDAARAGAVGHV